jgi:hypothetical protein
MPIRPPRPASTFQATEFGGVLFFAFRIASTPFWPPSNGNGPVSLQSGTGPVRVPNCSRVRRLGRTPKLTMPKGIIRTLPHLPKSGRLSGDTVTTAAEPVYEPAHYCMCLLDVE